MPATTLFACNFCAIFTRVTMLETIKAQFLCSHDFPSQFKWCFYNFPKIVNSVITAIGKSTTYTLFIYVFFNYAHNFGIFSNSSRLVRR